MPDEKKKRKTAEDVYEKLDFSVEVKLDAILKKQTMLEALLMQVLTMVNPKENPVAIEVKIDKDNPFWDEDKQAYSMKSYRSKHPKDKEEA